jgi:hypothetical protein
LVALTMSAAFVFALEVFFLTMMHLPLFKALNSHRRAHCPVMQRQHSYLMSPEVIKRCLRGIVRFFREGGAP